MGITNKADAQGFVFRMEEGDDGLPLAGIFWLHSKLTDGEVSQRSEHSFTKTDEIDELDLPHDTTAPELESIRSDTSPLPVVSLDFAAIRRLVPEGTSALTLVHALRDGDKELKPITKEHWVQRVFNENYFRARPPSIGKAEREEAAFIRDTLELPQTARVFDAGCGYGRIAIPLAELGAQVTAMDISVAMTSKTIEFANEANVALDVREGDFRQCHYENAFDAVICADTTFGSYSDAENLATLQAFRQSLKPKGRLYLEVINRDACIRELPGRTWWEGRGCLVQEDSEFVDTTSHLKLKRLVVTAEGGQDEHWVQIRLYSLHEITALLTMMGFKIIEVSGSYRTRSAFFVGHSQRIAVVAEKLDDEGDAVL